MGQAKKKAAQLALWKQTLLADERIVLDAALCAYSYHSARSPDALALVERLGRDPVCRDVVRHKEIEHQKMATIAKSPGLMRQFLDTAPDGLDYEALASCIRQGISTQGG
jgi:hypothetical protein